jgi:hypothetical protein
MKSRMPVKFKVGDIARKKFNAFREKAYLLILAIKENEQQPHKPKYIYMILDSNTPYYVTGEQRTEECEWLDHAFDRTE